MKKLILAFFAMAMCVACNTTPTNIFNKIWQLEKMNDKSIDRAIVSRDDSFSMQLMENNGVKNFGAIGDMNSCFGPITIDETKKTIVFTPKGTTRANPKNAKMEEDFFKLLTTIKSYSVKGEKLQLKNGDNKVVATFVLVPQEKTEEQAAE